MLQVARLAPKLLGESTGLVESFLHRQQHHDGGFRGRSDQSDLYYTVFGLESLLALRTHSTEPDTHFFRRTQSYLEGFSDGAGLNFVHLCCLARCWASLSNAGCHGADAFFRKSADGLLARIEQLRTADGGYNAIPGSAHGTAYASFLALGAYQDLRATPPEAVRLADSLSHLQTPDGAWTNERVGAPTTTIHGSTNATAAAVTVLRHLHRPVSPRTGMWLLARAHPQGGFLAVPNAPLPDLLSTATALHALAGLQVSLESVRETCLDFIDSLWTNEGGFYGHWHDTHLDCEYTYYALLALGHLSL